jgi:hypothetical protein
MVFHDDSALQLLAMAPRYVHGLTVVSRHLPDCQLLRRAIGRHIAAKQCDTDIIWFADADYYFGADCINNVTDQVCSTDGLRFPRQIQENVDQSTGDAMIDDNRDVKWPTIDSTLFKPRRRQFAIGGLQIVGGRTAKEKGYLGGTKWTRPVNPDKGWCQTGEDVHFRREFESSQPIDVDNLYWIRHDTKGADMDGTGTYIGKAAW